MTGRTNDDHIFYRSPAKFYPTVERGEGVYLWDTEGKRYLDGSGGAVVASIGHGVREIAAAAAAQMEKVSFIHGSQFTSGPAVDLAERLVRMSPPGLDRVYYCSIGSEAVETAVKMARQYQVDRGKPSKYKVISRWTSFHGNSLGALALGGHTGRRKYYLPLFPHTPHIPPAYCYRCPWGREPLSCALECAEELERAILCEGPDAVSAFIAEPVVGATAGCLVPREGYFQRIREICDRYDVLLIADEVMTGIGRTGRNFALEHWDVVPDLIVCAKGLSAGYHPVNAVIAKEEIHRVIRETTGTFVHGHTYSQNPLGCAVALAVLDYMDVHGLVVRSFTLGGYLLEKLRALYRHPIVGDVRGLGLFAGVELVMDRKTKETFDPVLKMNARIGSRAFAKGLITYPGGGGADGVNGDHILLAPPFIITEAQIDDLVAILDAAIGEVSAESGL